MASPPALCSVVSSTSLPVKIVPRIPSCRNSSPIASRPLACSIAITALVPVPQGDRSMLPVHVPGRSQSRWPVDMITAFEADPPARGGPRMAIFQPASRSVGCATGCCCAVATLIISPTRTRSAASASCTCSPTAVSSTIAYHMPPYAMSTVTVPSGPFGTRVCRPRCWGRANAGALVKVMCSALPPEQVALIRMGPAGASSTKSVFGSTMGTMPLSRSAVATQMVLCPDIAG
mmetsp:Transcript_30246/g.101083  ORF Transcript_30246/g.101083 Transcript_30246/m.101083 type:complete len:233 (-) Transcript_30246:283-981(-)